MTICYDCDGELIYPLCVPGWLWGITFGFLGWKRSSFIGNQVKLLFVLKVFDGWGAIDFLQALFFSLLISGTVCISLWLSLACRALSPKDCDLYSQRQPSMSPLKRSWLSKAYILTKYHVSVMLLSLDVSLFGRWLCVCKGCLFTICKCLRSSRNRLYKFFRQLNCFYFRFICCISDRPCSLTWAVIMLLLVLSSV